MTPERKSLSENRIRDAVILLLSIGALLLARQPGFECLTAPGLLAAGASGGFLVYDLINHNHSKAS